jgi:N-acetylneuraminic acid mutarotase
MLVFGRQRPLGTIDVAASYDPRTHTWRRLSPLRGPTGNYEGRYWAVWTGTEMLVEGPLDLQRYDPATNRWRRLPAKAAVPGGIVVWTGRELIGWGGGCCGDASADGAAFNPATNTRRVLARSPLTPAQSPVGAWTGRELVVLVSGRDPDGKPYPARFARAAAYDPRTDTWRRIPPLPAWRGGANVVWDGREVLVVGGWASPGAGRTPVPVKTAFAFDPAANRWRRLAPMPAGRSSAAAVWTGTRLLLWGGTMSAQSAALPVTPKRGLAYDPRADRWSVLPESPIAGRLGPTAVWTGRSMIVWGGNKLPSLHATSAQYFADGAAFRPAR